MTSVFSCPLPRQANEHPQNELAQHCFDSFAGCFAGRVLVVNLIVQTSHSLPWIRSVSSKPFAPGSTLLLLCVEINLLAGTMANESIEALELKTRLKLKKLNVKGISKDTQLASLSRVLPFRPCPAKEHVALLSC